MKALITQLLMSLVHAGLLVPKIHVFNVPAAIDFAISEIGMPIRARSKIVVLAATQRVATSLTVSIPWQMVPGVWC